VAAVEDLEEAVLQVPEGGQAQGALELELVTSAQAPAMIAAKSESSRLPPVTRICVLAKSDMRSVLHRRDTFLPSMPRFLSPLNVNDGLWGKNGALGSFRCGPPVRHASSVLS
jgi:hypothetical protein